MSIFFFISGCIFLVSEGRVQAEDTDYYGLSKYEKRTPSPTQETTERLPRNSQRIKLRSSYRDLSLSQVHSMPNISMRKDDQWGFYGHSTINHNYETTSINGDVVVIDHTTDLMWHQSGSSDYMRWSIAENWIRNLNNRGYAGYHNWRLPTLEEAASLLASDRHNNLYINSVFHDEQWGIWTGDTCGSAGAWSVYFSLGNVRWNVKNRYVRPLRSMK